MKYFAPIGVDIDLVDGTMTEPDRHYITTASKMKGYYADEAALEEIVLKKDDPVLYEVFEKDIPEEHGHILFCISRLLPGRIGDEFSMTKGHFHTILETAESYLCISGTGVMMLKTPEGHCHLEPFRRGRLVYVPPSWAHRSINTGKTPLVSLCHYQADAGHNYGDIVTEGFPKRVFDRGGRIVVE